MAVPKTKTSQPCSPREFFERIYGHLENSKERTLSSNQLKNDEKPSDLIAPIPLLPTPLPFFLNPANDTPHLSIAAAAGISAF
ncbi:hypothetical protein HHI36_017451, partial [Cryptolaemus montrouzieri]